MAKKRVVRFAVHTVRANLYLLLDTGARMKKTKVHDTDLEPKLQCLLKDKGDLS